MLFPTSSSSTTRNSDHYSPATIAPTDGDGFIPMTLDTSPLTRPAPLSRTRSDDHTSNGNTLPGSEQVFRDDFRDLLAGSSGSRSASKDRSRMSPHIAQQELGRQPSNNRTHGIRQRNQSTHDSPSMDTASPAMGGFERVRKPPPPPPPPPELDAAGERFKLQEAPKVRRRSSGSRHASKGSAGTTSPSMALAGQTEGTPMIEQGVSAPTTIKVVGDHVADLPKRKASNRRSPLSQTTSGNIPERPTRQDSLRKAATKQQIPRKEVPISESDMASNTSRSAGAEPSLSTSDAMVRQGPSTVGSKSMASPVDSDSFELPPRSSSRPAPAPGIVSSTMRSADRDDFTAPREAPAPPPMRHKPNESVSSIQSEHFESSSPFAIQEHPPTFLSEEDDSRFNREEDIEHPGIFRKVSKAVRHGRSHSDKIGSPSPKWQHKASRNGSVDISSPMMNTLDGQEDTVHLRNKLRFSQQRIAELETEKTTLQQHANSTADMRQVTQDLREKRKTINFLDTQREMIIRELETMTDQLAKAKESKSPIDLESLQSEALKALTQQLDDLRNGLHESIEVLMRQKNNLTTEIADLIQMKDKGFQEYESLSAKNQNLVDHNNKLTQHVQLLYQQGRQGNAPAPFIPPPSGLGIYTSNLKDKNESQTGLLSIDTTNTQLSGDTELEPATVLTAPQVVNIRKGQPKKFSWKKGSESMAKNVKRGFKGAFAVNGPSMLKEEQFSEGAPYGAMSAGEAPFIGDKPVGQRNATDATRPAPLQREISGQGQPWAFMTQKGGNPTKAGKDAKPLGLPANTCKSTCSLLSCVQLS